MFENLTNKLENIFSKLKNAPSLTEEQVDSGLKEIRLALLDADVALSVTKEFISKVKSVNWQRFHSENPFKDSGLALYNWSPIADELKVLDKEIVLNSIKLKWNLVENEFKDLTKNLTFN